MNEKTLFKIEGEEPITVTEDISLPMKLVTKKRLQAKRDKLYTFMDIYQIHIYTDEFGNEFEYEEKIESKCVKIENI